MMKNVIIIFIITLFSGCSVDKNPITLALKSKDLIISEISNNYKKYELQVKLSVINKNNQLKEYDFNLDPNNYYYPASTVKLPISIFALEKINENQLLNIDTPYKIEKDSTTSTIRKDINEIMVMSSNDAYNRLFEFLGQDLINLKLKEKGMMKSKIFHRLETENPAELITKKLIFSVNDTLNIDFNSKINNKLKPLKINGLNKGVGFIDKNGKLINKPMGFSKKNYLPLNELHLLTKLIYFSDSDKKNKLLNLNDEQISFLKESMSSFPKEIGYDVKKYPDTYSNFLVFGNLKKPLDGVEIYNKIGFAYGYISETAIIKSEKSSIIISMSLKVNKNNIYNDNNYEYDEIGFPFFAKFGKEILEIIDEINY